MNLPTLVHAKNGHQKRRINIQGYLMNLKSIDKKKIKKKFNVLNLVVGVKLIIFAQLLNNKMYLQQRVGETIIS